MGNSVGHQRTQSIPNPSNQTILNIGPGRRRQRNGTVPTQSHSLRAMGIHKTSVVQNPINLRKTTLKLIPTDIPGDYRVSFLFDSLNPCTVQVFLACTQVDTAERRPPDFQPIENASLIMPAASFPAGTEQTYTSEPFNCEKIANACIGHENVHPVVIQLSITLPGKGLVCQQTFATLLETTDIVWRISCSGQRLFIGNNTYNIQDIYGLDRIASQAQDGETLGSQGLVSGRECVICLAEERNTALLPCGHICLCLSCADVLRIQSPNCPICRQAVKNLLKISNSDEEKDHQTV